MQWHPIFVQLLRPLLETHYEVKTGVTVGDLPRAADIVVVHRTAAGPAPYQGLWRHLTTWNVLELKGPTVSARLDDLHDLVELGLGVHRRLNEQQAKDDLPTVGRGEVSFWYLVRHLGSRFLPDAGDLFGQELAGLDAGAWRVRVLGHPVFLVSAQALAADRDSLPLHVLTREVDAAPRSLAGVLAAEPALLPAYASWLVTRQPSLWEELLKMATQQTDERDFDFRPLVKYLGMAEIVRRLGTKEVIQGVGPETAIQEAFALLTPEQREAIFRKWQEEGKPTEK